MNRNKPLKIIIDDRETKLCSLFDKKEDRILEYEKKRLSVADIIVSSEIGIERKEGFDFANSLTDNRLFDQLLRLKDNYNIPILILEGLNQNVFNNIGVSINSIYGALSFISYKLRICVIPTINLEHTAIVIERIAYREQVKDDLPLIRRVAPKEMSKKDRRSFIIEGLIDIGPKKAKALIEKFKTPYNVFKAIKKTEILFTRTNNP
ncbi:MAG: hypothetical protein EU529_10685, partial [Promethearchaeota archaeon]